MQELVNYIRPELLVLAPVLYFLGVGMKKSQLIKVYPSMDRCFMRRSPPLCSTQKYNLLTGNRNLYCNWISLCLSTSCTLPSNAPQHVPHHHRIHPRSAFHKLPRSSSSSAPCIDRQTHYQNLLAVYSAPQYNHPPSFLSAHNAVYPRTHKSA